jgi:PAS domain-containing protein
MLNLENADLRDALDDFTLRSGYLIVARLDADGIVLGFNRGFESAVRPAGDPRGRPFSDFVSTAEGRAPDIEPGLPGGSPVPYPLCAWSGKHLLLHAYPSADGHTVLVGSITSLGDDQEIQRMSRLTTEMTNLMRELRRANQRISENLRQLAIAERIAKIGNWRMDPAEGVFHWSDEAYRLYERDPALGPPTMADYESVYAGDDRDRFRAAIQAAVDHGHPYEVTLRFVLPDGRVKWVFGVGAPEPTPGPSGHVVHGTVQDITERKLIEDQRADLERIIRHDLRSPAAATLDGLQLLRLHGSLTDQQHTIMDMMERSAIRQLRMLDTAMTLNRLEAGTYKLDPEPMDLGSLLDNISDETRKLCEQRRAVVRVASAPGVHALGDPRLTENLLSNLVRNALEALPEQGQAVDVAMRADGDMAVIRITNPGAVPEHIRDRFFDKNVTSGKRRGTGIGTYSALKMTRVQGGTIILDTSVEGMTTVEVRLPLFEDGTPN